MFITSPHGKLSVPNNEDYNNGREFFQEEGLEGSFEIDLNDVMGMEVDNERVACNIWVKSYRPRWTKIRRGGRRSRRGWRRSGH